MKKEDLKFRYFNGEKECPQKYEDDIRGHYWFIEKYVNDHAEEYIDRWEGTFDDLECRGAFWEKRREDEYPNALAFVGKAWGKFTLDEIKTGCFCGFVDDFKTAETYNQYFELEP